MPGRITQASSSATRLPKLERCPPKPNPASPLTNFSKKRAGLSCPMRTGVVRTSSANLVCHCGFTLPIWYRARTLTQRPLVSVGPTPPPTPAAPGRNSANNSSQRGEGKGGQKTVRVRVMDWEHPANPAMARLVSQFSVTGAPCTWRWRSPRTMDREVFLLPSRAFLLVPAPPGSQAHAESERADDHELSRGEAQPSLIYD